MEYVPTFTNKFKPKVCKYNRSHGSYAKMFRKLCGSMWFISLYNACQVSPMEIKMVRPPPWMFVVFLDDVFFHKIAIQVLWFPILHDQMIKVHGTVVPKR